MHERRGASPSGRKPNLGQWHLSQKQPGQGVMQLHPRPVAARQSRGATAPREALLHGLVIRLEVPLNNRAILVGGNLSYIAML